MVSYLIYAGMLATCALSYWFTDFDSASSFRNSFLPVLFVFTFFVNVAVALIWLAWRFYTPPSGSRASSGWGADGDVGLSGDFSGGSDGGSIGGDGGGD